MYWHFTGNNGQGFPSFILWLAVGGFIGTVGRISLCNGEYERYQLILFCNLVIPVMLVFIISSVDAVIYRSLFLLLIAEHSSLLAVLLTRAKSGLWLLVYLIHLIIRLWFIS